MTKETKSKRLQLRSDPAFIKRVRLAVAVAGYASTAELFRESVDEKIAKLSKKFPQLNETETQPEQAIAA
jgi:hypothetical protein